MSDVQQFMNAYGEAADKGDAEKALAALDGALGVDAAYIPALGCKGTLLGHLQRHDDALACFERIVAIQPDSGPGHYSCGVHLQELGRWDEAIAAYTKATEVDPDDPDAYINRGRLLDDRGEPEDAIADYDRALALNDGEEIAWANRGNSLLALGRFDDAVASYDRALSLEPDSDATKLGRSNALLALGRLEEANAARPAGTPLDRGEAVEVRAPLANGSLVAYYFPHQHSNPELLAAACESVVSYCASLEDKPPGLSDGIVIGYGWSRLTLRARGDDIVLCEPNFSRHPMSELCYDISFSLQSIVMTQVLHSVVGVDACECSCVDDLIIADGAILEPELILHRIAPTRERTSGWIIGPRNVAEVDALLDSEQFDVVPSAVIASVRPHLIKVLSLPPGFQVTMYGHAVTSVLDEEGNERWSDAAN